MGVFERLNKLIPTGRKTSIDGRNENTVVPNFWNGGLLTANAGENCTENEKILHVLNALERPEEKIRYLRKTTPEVGMAVWNFLRLSNQGSTITFYDEKGNADLKLEEEWREFASRIGGDNTMGLDGVIDKLHYSYYVLGAMAIEVAVSKDRHEIEDVYVVSPETINFKLEDLDGVKTFVPYQVNGKNEVKLDKRSANFFYIANDPEINNPRGSLPLQSVIAPLQLQMDLQVSLSKIIYRQGFPKLDITFDKEKIISSLDPSITSDPKKLQRVLGSIFNQMAAELNNLNPESHFIHTDDYTIRTVEGASASRSIDIRALYDMTGEQVTNGMKTLGAFVNKSSGKTETWSTVEFSIMVNYIKSCQKASKRMIENVAKLWLRVQGIQRTAVFTHKSIDYKSDKDKEELKAARLEYAKGCLESGFMTEEEARDYATKNI